MDPGMSRARGCLPARLEPAATGCRAPQRPPSTCPSRCLLPGTAPMSTSAPAARPWMPGAVHPGYLAVPCSMRAAGRESLKGRWSLWRCASEQVCRLSGQAGTACPPSPLSITTTPCLRLESTLLALSLSPLSSNFEPTPRNSPANKNYTHSLAHTQSVCRLEALGGQRFHPRTDLNREDWKAVDSWILGVVAGLSQLDLEPVSSLRGI